MSYGPPTAAPTAAARPRPGTVTAAGMLLYGLAGLTVISILVSLALFSTITNAAQDAYAGLPNASTVTDAIKIGAVVGVVLDVVIVVLLVLLAAFNLRGNNGMRITTWVVTGLGVLCFGCGAISGGLQGRFSVSGSGNVSSQQLNAAAQRMQDALPGWYHGESMALSVLSLLICAAVIILLAMPASNQFFRKAEPEFVPYPVYPQVPPPPPPAG